MTLGHRWRRITNVNPKLRNRFDRLLEEVLAELPASVRRLLEEAPLHVEDYPSRTDMKRLGAESRDELCGLYTGVPLTERSLTDGPGLPSVVTIFREGILAMAADEAGRVVKSVLREEIRKTILHELAHHYGMEEEELEDLGYG